MSERTGILIVVEGTDGSGKHTQVTLLKGRLEQAGYEVVTFEFPQYDRPSSYFVREYLAGAYGQADQVGPYTSSLFYALDRYEAAPRLRQALEQGKVVLCDRYTGSNMAHQGTKFRNAEERRGFFIWLDNLEFEMLRIPRPDINFVLRVPPEVSQTLVAQREAQQPAGNGADIHEANNDHQQRAAAVYDDMTRLFPKDFQRVDCVRNNQLLDPQTIHSMLWEKISPLLPPVPPKPAGSAQAASPAPQSAATAEQSASTATPQSGNRVVIEGASNLLLLRLERGRAGAFVERREALGQAASYVIPDTLPEKLQAAYQKQMDTLFELYGALADQLNDYLVANASAPESERTTAWADAIRAQAYQALAGVLPVATRGTVALEVTPSSLPALLTQLLGDDLPESRHILPAIFKFAGQSSQNETITKRAAEVRAVLSDVAKQHLPAKYAAETASLQLTDFWPRNEIDLLPDALYPHSNLTLEDLRETVQSWPYDRKLAAFEAYLRDGALSARSLHKARYTWDAVSDLTVARDLQRYQLINDFQIQELTPRYGYELPQLVDEAGLTDQYEECFALSLKLHSQLQEAGFGVEAQYAVLFGHKQRWTLTLTARDCQRLFQALPAAASYRQLVLDMHEKLGEVHPLLNDVLPLGPPPSSLDKQG